MCLLMLNLLCFGVEHRRRGRGGVFCAVGALRGPLAHDGFAYLRRRLSDLGRCQRMSRTRMECRTVWMVRENHVLIAQKWRYSGSLAQTT
jgi:hypothetical protein